MKIEKQNSKRWLPVALLALISLVFSCKKTEIADPRPTTYTSDAAVKWSDMTLYVMIHTTSNTPTYSSRAFAYLGLAMYESVQAGSTTNKSMAGQLTDLATLPTIEQGKRYNWEIGRASCRERVCLAV